METRAAPWWRAEHEGKKSERQQPLGTGKVPGPGPGFWTGGGGMSWLLLVLIFVLGGLVGAYVALWAFLGGKPPKRPRR